MLRKIHEELTVGEKASDSAKEMFKNPTESKAVGTDIRNIDWEILDSIAIDKRLNE